MQRDEFFFALSKTEQYERIDFNASIHQQRYFKVPSPLSKKTQTSLVVVQELSNNLRLSGSSKAANYLSSLTELSFPHTDAKA